MLKPKEEYFNQNPVKSPKPEEVHMEGVPTIKPFKRRVIASKPVSKQTSLQANQQTSEPLSKQVGLEASGQTNKPVSKQVSKETKQQVNKQLRKIASYLTADTYKKWKVAAASRGVKDYELLQEAMEEYLRK